MKKFLLSALCAVTTLFAGAKDLTFTFTAGSSLNNYTDQGITFTKTKGNAPAWNTNNSALAWAADGTVKITSTVGNITKITIIGTKNKPASGNDNSCSDKFKLVATPSDVAFTYDDATKEATTTLATPAATATIYHASGVKQTFISSIIISVEDNGENPENPDDKTLGDILVDGEKLTEAKTVDPETQLTFSCANASIMEVSVGDALASDTNSADNIAWTAPADAGTYNLTVIAMKGSGETFSETSAEFTIIVKSQEVDPTPTPASDAWTWVKSTDGLDVGARYIIAYVADKKAISTVSGGNNRKTTSITLTEDKSEITNPSGNVMTFVLEKITENEKDYYLWKSENLDATTQGYLYGPTGTSNHLNCTNPQETNLNKRYSTISISQEGDATITFINCTKNSDNFVIKYNPSSNLFASYISTSTGMQLVQLYKAPATAKLLFHETTDEVGESIELTGSSKKIHFEVADGVEVWHKFVVNGAKGIAAQAETDEDGFEKYDGNGVELTQAGELHYYTKTASGLKSTTKKLAVTGSTSAISEISAEQNGAEVIYDLQGRRVTRAVKGLFIVNGKKELRK